MPLSKPVSREKLHTRHIECCGYERKDGLFDIEGHLVDTKTYAYESSWRGRMEPGMPVHEMWIRLTIDSKLLVHEVEAVTDFGPFQICPDITPNFKRLEGLRIGPAWNRRARELVGGVEGCTHIFEMLSQVATTGYQTLVRKRSQQHEKREAEGKAGPRRAPPMLLNTCHAWSTKGELVKKIFPGQYKVD